MVRLPQWIQRISAPLIGSEATPLELALGWGAAFVAGALQLGWAWAYGDWTAFQVAVAVLFAFDIGGGVVVNATHAGRAWWHRPTLGRSRHLAFYAAHLHPFLLVWLWPEYTVWQAAALYASMLLFAITVSLWTPQEVARPVAYGLTAVGVVLGATVLRAPDGLVWLPMLYYIKLIAAHAVPDP